MKYVWLEKLNKTEEELNGASSHRLLITNTLDYLDNQNIDIRSCQLILRLLRPKRIEAEYTIINISQNEAKNLITKSKTILNILKTLIKKL